MTIDAALQKISKLLGKMSGRKFVLPILRRAVLISLCIPLLFSTALAQSNAALSRRLTVADLDGNRLGDLVWTNLGTGEVSIRLLDDSNPEGKEFTRIGLSTIWQISGFGDLNGDGKADAIWRNRSSGSVMVWLMDGNTVKSQSILSSGQPLEWQISGVGDLDGDHKADLIWRNTRTGDVTEWLIDGDTIKSQTLLSHGLALEWKINGIGDLDGDGKADLIWRNTRTGDVAEWLINGDIVKSWSVIATNFDLTWRLSSVGDLDGDGRTDLVWSNGLTGEVLQWFMGGDFVKSWSRVDPIPEWASSQYTPDLTEDVRLEKFTVTSYEKGGMYYFVPSIRLRETSGKVGVRVTSLLFQIVNAGAVVTAPLWQVSKRIEAGASRDMIDLNFNGSGDPEFEISSPINAPYLYVYISYVDDMGLYFDLMAPASISASPNLMTSNSENRANHLHVEQFSVTRNKTENGFTYVPSIRLKETDGTFGIVVSSLIFRLDDIGTSGNVPPWEVSKRIDAGASRDMNDLNFQGYGDPEFEISSSRISSSVSVTIVFTDDAGRSGMVTTATRISE